MLGTEVVDQHAAEIEEEEGTSAPRRCGSPYSVSRKSLTKAPGRRLLDVVREP